MREDDLLKFRWIADPRISPDGTRVAFTLVRVDVDEDEYRTDLWLVGLVDDEAKPFFGVPVYPRNQLRSEGVAGTPFERVVVMSFGEIDDVRATLEEQNIPAERISWL